MRCICIEKEKEAFDRVPFLAWWPDRLQRKKRAVPKVRDVLVGIEERKEKKKIPNQRSEGTEYLHMCREMGVYECTL